MPDWLMKQFKHAPELAAQVALSVAFGFLVAGIFRATMAKRERSVSLLTTLILLAVMTAILTLTIGENTARAFGLVGALSIVRFRTVVEDTRDTAFVIFSVVVGMEVGANQILLAGLACAAVAVVAALMHWAVPGGRTPTACKLQLCIRIGLGRGTDQLIEVIQRYAGELKAIGAATAKQGAAMEVTYSLRLTGEPESMIPLFAELSKIDGVQGVELKENPKG